MSASVLRSLLVGGPRLRRHQQAGLDIGILIELPSLGVRWVVASSRLRTCSLVIKLQQGRGGGVLLPRQGTAMVPGRAEAMMR